MTENNQEKVWIGCEVQSAFHIDFKALAKDNSRSLAGEIRIALESHLRKQTAKKHFISTTTPTLVVK